jgi:hypothetical protein
MPDKIRERDGNSGIAPIHASPSRQSSGLLCYTSVVISWAEKGFERPVFASSRLATNSVPGALRRL